jgi:hypothetical protein
MTEVNEKTHLINSISETFGSINSTNEPKRILREGRQRTARQALKKSKINSKMKLCEIIEFV